MTKQELERTLLTYNDYLDKMLGVILHVCDDLRENELTPLELVMPALIDGLGWIYESAGELVKHGLIDQSALHNFETLIPKMAGMMEQSDLLQVHAVFRYELPAVLIKLKILNTAVS